MFAKPDSFVLCSRFDSNGKCTTVPQVHKSVTIIGDCRRSAAIWCSLVISHEAVVDILTMLQANEKRIEETACASSRSCVKSYPVQVGLVCEGHVVLCDSAGIRSSGMLRGMWFMDIVQPEWHCPCCAGSG